MSWYFIRKESSRAWILNRKESYTEGSTAHGSGPLLLQGTINLSAAHSSTADPVDSLQKTHLDVLVCFVNRKSSKSEGKFPTFRSGNPHYPKETCREFSVVPLSSRQESSIHCFLPNRVIRVRLCQRLPERFAFSVLSFDSAPAPG